MARRHLLCALALLTPALAADDAPELTPAEAGTAFQRNCLPCHTIPDKTSTFDVAWLDQVNRTA